MSDAAAARPAGRPPRKRLGRLERPAVFGVMLRDIINFTSFWRATTFSSIVEPTIYLLAFGLGLGAIVSEVAGYDYIDFVATGTVATAVLFTSAFGSMFGSFVKREFQRTYDAILAAPVDVEELVTGEILWMSLRAGVYGCSPLVVGVVFGLEPRWTVVITPGVAFLTGIGFSALGILIAAIAKSIDNFSYITSGVFTPMFLVAGTFFPISELPYGARVLAQLNPLHHCVELVRYGVFGFDDGALVPLARTGALVAFALIAWRLAIWRTRARVIS